MLYRLVQQHATLSSPKPKTQRALSLPIPPCLLRAVVPKLEKPVLHGGTA